MTVKELIIELSKMPQDMHVEIHTEIPEDFEWGTYEVNEITTSNNLHCDETVVALISHNKCDDYCDLPL